MNTQLTRTNTAQFDFDVQNPDVASEIKEMMERPKTLISRLFPTKAQQEQDEMARRLIRGHADTHFAVVSAIQRTHVDGAKSWLAFRLASYEAKLKIQFGTWFTEQLETLGEESRQFAVSAAQRLRLSLQNYEETADLPDEARAAFRDLIMVIYLQFVERLKTGHLRLMTEIDERIQMFKP